MRKSLLATLALVVSLAAITTVACVVTSPPPEPTTVEPPPPAPAPVTNQPESPPEAMPPQPAKAGEGRACLTGSECESGICEGQGCGDIAGRCASAERMCTMDLVPYCGCDGQTFRGSSGCPKQRFAHRGECGSSGAGASGSKVADGGACDTGAQCASGVCEGQGCGPGQGVCAPAKRACTRDLRAYCGCDGQTFRASGSCPAKRYSKTVPC